MRDNQGRNLDAVKRHFDMLARQRLAKALATNAKVDSTIASRATGLRRPYRVTTLARASRP